jgi:dTDP-4-dehydrorhamnose reductase
MDKILVFGANGQVGMELRDVYQNYGHWDVIFLSRNDGDITNYEVVRKIVLDHKPKFIINSAAYTKVDLAEKEITEAYASNAYAVGNLSKICNEYDVVFIHISSDYVYHNQVFHPIREQDETSPKSNYGVTKLIGDKLCLHFNPKSIVLRSSWIYSKYGNNFVKTMLKLAQTHPFLSIVNDQYGCPTSAKDLAHTVATMIDKIRDSQNPNELFGIYNYSNEGVTNWLEFAKNIFKIKGVEIQLTSTTTQIFNAPAARPKWSVMNISKIKKTFGIVPRHWTKALEEMLEEI